MPSPLQNQLLKLKRAPGKEKGTKAPHKPVLLLSVLELFEEGILNDNRIHISPELVATFQKLWAQLVPSPHWQPRIFLPFFHLGQEKSGIWRLQSKGEMGDALTKSYSPKSTSALDAVIDHAQLSKELYTAMLDPIQRELVRTILMETYFPNARYESKHLQSERANYLKIMEQNVLTGLAAELGSEDVEEVRGTIFKQQVPKLYNYQCAISGFKMVTTQNASLLDACHIQPWSVNHLDTIQNGICLSPLLHRAFDRNLISVDEEYRVMVSSDYMEEGNSPHSILQFKEKQIHLPANKEYWPAQELLAEHRSQMVS